VAIIGAGPAGSMSAYHLSRAGLSVLLLEKEQLPRYKTCGGGLVYRARKLVPDLPEHVIERECFEVDWGIHASGLHYRIERPYPVITMVMRDKLDNHLVQRAANQGAVVLDNTGLESLNIDGSVTIGTSAGKFQCKLLIAADGASSPTAKMAGLRDDRYLIPAIEAEVELDPTDFGKYASKTRFDVDAMPMGYGWVFPKKNHLSIGIASEVRGRIKLKQAYRNYRKILGINQVTKEEIHGFQIPITSRKIFSGNRILLTGDAAGLADPLLAEGISHALISGKLAADSIIAADLDPRKAGKLYSELLEKEILHQVKTGQLLSKLFYNYPGLRRFVLRRKGQRLTEYFTDVFSGDRRYPEGIGDVSRGVLKAIF
jgi:geranylgeranyl reductase family protein